MGRDDLLRWKVGEGRRADEHLVGQDAHGVEVGPVIQVGVGRRLLRRHVRGRPHHEAGRGDRGAARGVVQRLRDPEVGHLGVGADEQDVLRLDVAVDDAQAVGVAQRVDHVAQDPERVGHR
jgi:hypothetical protein